MIDKKTTEKIRSQAGYMEQKGRLSNEALEYIYDKGLFKLFVPAEIGGSIKPLPEALKIFEAAAHVDGSFGWVVQIGSGAGFFATTIKPDQVRKYFSVRDFYIAGSEKANGTARKTDDGYMINGTWRFCSGADHASLFTASCIIESNDTENGSLYAFAFTPDQVTVEADWNAFGLKATSSHTIHVKDALVPTKRRFDVSDPHFHFDHPVYHYPFTPFAVANIAATVMGVASHFFEAARNHIESKKARWSKNGSNHYAHTKKILAENEADFLKSRANFYEKIESSWNNHSKGIPLTSKEMETVFYQSKIVVHFAVTGAQTLIRYLGMDVVMADHPLNRIYRDLHTASQHGLLVDTEGEVNKF